MIRWDVQFGEQIGEPVALRFISDLTCTIGRWLQAGCQVLGGRTFSKTERRRIMGAAAPTIQRQSG